MSNENDPEGYNAAADAIKQILRKGGTRLDAPDAICKLMRGDDLAKATRLPPQSDDADDDEELGVSGGTGTSPQIQTVPRKRKRRTAVDDATQARRGRADRDEDEDEDEDDGDSPSRKGRADRDEASGQFKSRDDDAVRQRRTLKLLKSIHASGPLPLGWAEALSLNKLAGLPNPRTAQQRDLLHKLEGAIDTLRGGGHLDAAALAQAVGAAVRRYHN